MRLLDAAAELDAANGVNLIVGSSPDVPLTDARKLALEKSAELASEAKKRGTRLLLEPMHPLQARSKGCVNTLKQASDWLESIPDLCLNIDLFHSWWDPDLKAALTGKLGTVAIVQICDVVTDPMTNLPKRAPLGEGFVDWSELSGSALSAFPDIPIELEWFADQMTDRDTTTLMRSDAKQMQTLKGLGR
ncbi:MAG: sugar phosphate isomerase/epimerase [Burkholderiaceae bacterium]|nr:sugar phosphate isomerase/epimerase [Burkholderiaceae bacterium]